MRKWSCQELQKHPAPQLAHRHQVVTLDTMTGDVKNKLWSHTDGGPHRALLLPSHLCSLDKLLSFCNPLCSQLKLSTTVRHRPSPEGVQPLMRKDMGTNPYHTRVRLCISYRYSTSKRKMMWFCWKLKNGGMESKKQGKLP